MATTYLELTNRVLRRLNEVELTSSNFASVKGIHAAAKDAVLDTVRKINNKKFKWPFNAYSTSGSQVLTVGQETYAWPSQFLSVDWNSFQIVKDDALSVSHKNLKFLTREEWYKSHRDTDMDTETDGRGLPYYVFQAQNNKWGVTPSPDEAYTVQFDYWVNPSDLSAHGDICLIPSEFDYVITAGALYHMYLFHDNTERTQLSKQALDDGISDMVNRYLGENHVYAHSTLVNR